MQVPLDRALFLKDTLLLSDAEWQSMSATRGRGAAANLQIYPTLHQVRQLRAALNARPPGRRAARAAAPAAAGPGPSTALTSGRRASH